MFYKKKEIQNKRGYLYALNPYCEWCGQDIIENHQDFCPVAFGNITLDQKIKARESYLLTFHQKPGGPLKMGPEDPQINQRLIYEVTKLWLQLFVYTINQKTNVKTGRILGFFQKRKNKEISNQYMKILKNFCSIRVNLIPGSLSKEKLFELDAWCMNLIFYPVIKNNIEIR